MKKSANRVCSAALSAALAFSFMTFTAAGAAAYTADEPAEIYSYELDVTLGGGYDEASQAIYNALKNLDATVDVTGMGVTRSNAADVYTGVLKSHPDLFYASTTSSYVFYSSGDVVSYKLSYSYDTSVIPDMKESFDARVSEIMSLVSEDMTDFEKAVVLHDEIASSCNYQSDGYYNKTTAYDALIGGEAVCQGYSYAYAYLLSLAGVQSEYAESADMAHMWNKVCIDGEWYNVDLTWDDPVSALRGQAHHTYFLLSDGKISSDDMSSKHYNYTSVHAATSTKYDNALLHDIDTRLCDVSGSYYAICNDSESPYAKCLIKYDPASDTAEVVEQFEYIWPAGGDSYYVSSYMALQAYDGVLYFNTPSSLCSYDVSTGEQSTVVENILDSDASETEACYGIMLDGSDIYAAIAEGPSADSTELKFVQSVKTDDEPVGERTIGATAQITLSDGTTATVLYGDVNLDSKVDVSDVTCVQKAVAHIIELDEVQTAAANVNFDEAVNINDATYIQKYIAGII